MESIDVYISYLQGLKTQLHILSDGIAQLEIENAWYSHKIREDLTCMADDVDQIVDYLQRSKSSD